VVVRLPVATAPEGTALPRVHGLVARSGRGAGFFVPCDRLDRVRPGSVTLKSPAVALETFQQRPQELLLTKDVWDRRVIDCATHRVRRVNDVLLGRAGEQAPVASPEGYPAAELVLLGVDIGVRGILRRLGLERLLGGRLGARLPPAILPWERMELVAAAGPTAAARHIDLGDFHPVELAHLTEHISTQEAAYLIAGLDDKIAADVLEELPADRQLDIVEYLPDARAADILEEMAPDDATDLLGDLPDARTAALLEEMAPEAVAPVRTLLHYPDASAGGMMTTSYIHAPAQFTVAATIELLRAEVEKPDMIYYIYVTDTEHTRRLVGIVTLRDLLMAPADAVLHDIMRREFFYAAPEDTDQAVARKLAEYNLMALPVLDPGGHILGIITVDDALDVLLPTGWQRRLPRIFS
jgi:CBS domain-containing protein